MVFDLSSFLEHFQFSGKLSHPDLSSFPGILNTRKLERWLAQYGGGTPFILSNRRTEVANDHMEKR